VERAFDAGAVVVAEIADVVDHELKVLFGHFFMAEHDFAPRVAGLRKTAEVHDDFEEVNAALGFVQRLDNARRERLKQQVQVVGDDLFVWKDCFRGS
jgi:hypothetical protein